MHLTANNIEHILLIACVLYIVTECFACVRQIIAAERGIGRVPEGFSAKLTLKAHQKAAAYTTEAAQAHLIRAFAAVLFAVVMTVGHGLTVAAAFLETVSGNTLLVEWALLAIVLSLMTAFELPLSWLTRYRLRERFGYARRSQKEWLRRTSGSSLAGLAVFLPVAALMLLIFEFCGSYWWVALWFVYLGCLVWRWKLALMRGRIWSRASRPIANEALRCRVRSLLAEDGFEMSDLVLMTLPPIWKHAHVLIPGEGRKRTVVVFAQSAAKLTDDELLAVVASQLARVKLQHAPLRAALSALVGLVLCACAGWASGSPEFFSGIGFAPSLTVAQPGTHSGFTLAAALVVFPIVFFPLRIVFNCITRRLRYQADRACAEKMGGDALVRALTKLHRDYSTTLTPSRFYSLLHYERPHAGMRVAEILKWMRSKGVKLAAAGTGRETTVLAREKQIAREMRSRRHAFEIARSEAQKNLSAELEVERHWIDDDGFDDPPAAARTGGTPA